MKKYTKSSLVLMIFATAIIMGFITFEIGNTQSIDVVYVTPSGDRTGVTDADNIEIALLTVAAGGTVILSEGYFYTSRSIMISGFHGTFKGQNKDDTIIEAVRGPGGQGFELYYDPDYETEFPAVIFFHTPVGDVSIKDFTVQVIEPNLCDLWYVPWWDYYSTALLNFFAISHSESNTQLTNLRMQGAPVDAWPGFNVLYPYVQEDGYGDGHTHVVKECDFENSYVPVEFGMMYGNSGIIIKENTFSNHAAAIFIYSDNMNGIIKENIISHIRYAGILVSTSDNNNIRENNISNCGFYGINVRWGASNNLIKKNTIEGSGLYDLYWDGTGEGNIWNENEFDTKTSNINQEDD
jgi:parallel beta-helix repeat protein